MLVRRSLPMLVLCIALIGLGAGTSPARASASDPAVQVVERFHTLLIQTMKQSDTLNAAQRTEQLRPLMGETFDFRRMIQIAVGAQAWAGASSPEKDALTKGFMDMSVATYGAQFKHWTGEKFVTLGVNPGPRDARLVRTRMDIPNNDSVQLTYVVTPTKAGRWLITDVLINDSISQLAVRRSDYAAPIRDKGLGHLIAELNDQARKLTEGAP